MVDKQNNNRADNRDQNAVDIDACHTAHAERLKEVTSDNGTYDPQNDIQKYAFT